MEHILIPFSSNTNMNYEYLDVMRFFFFNQPGAKAFLTRIAPPAITERSRSVIDASRFAIRLHC